MNTCVSRLLDKIFFALAHSRNTLAPGFVRGSTTCPFSFNVAVTWLYNTVSTFRPPNDDEEAVLAMLKEEEEEGKVATDTEVHVWPMSTNTTTSSVLAVLSLSSLPSASLDERPDANDDTKHSEVVATAATSNSAKRAASHTATTCSGV